MKLLSVTVVGLFGSQDNEEYHFNEDLNIITGRNGAGKTTLLKLAWFIMSGNIIHAVKEIDFKVCTVKTSDYICIVYKLSELTCRVEFTNVDGTFFFEDDEDEEGTPFGDFAENKVAPYLIDCGSSIFFPTFRRIEGGFTLGEKSYIRNRPSGRSSSDIDEALTALSKKLTNKRHLFVSAISSKDINDILLSRYAAVSEEINVFQTTVSRFVIDKIKKYQKTQGSTTDADALLAETRSKIEDIEEYREKLMKPLEAVQKLVDHLFQHAGIYFGKRVSFGDAAEAVTSDVLSAGEKQMLSFICYNAFHQDAVIFIDEPELSLHVDWQRKLYKILKEQNSSNQFVFATHSPFIYGKYPDKEVIMDQDRGE